VCPSSQPVSAVRTTLLNVIARNVTTDGSSDSADVKNLPNDEVDSIPPAHRRRAALNEINALIVIMKAAPAPKVKKMKKAVKQPA